jgi:hypothetical protein
MKTIHHTALALALAAAFPALAQSNADVLRELQALKAQVAELEAKLKAQEAAKPQWGMTPDQARELNRVTVKAEALEDSRDSSGMKGLKISGYADPTYIYNRAKRNSGFSFLDSRKDTYYAYDNSYFGSVVLDLPKETDSGARWRLTLSPNRGTDTVIGNGSIVQEASVSVPMGSLQTRFIAGHLPDWSGYEFQQATLNKLITHNLLFDFTLPTSYTGAGLELTRGKWIAKGVLANMNAARNPDGVRAPVMAYRVDYSRGVWICRRAWQGGESAGEGRRRQPAAEPHHRDRLRRAHTGGPFRVRCLLHSRRLDGARPGQPGAAKGCIHHRGPGDRRSARCAMDRSFGTGCLQIQSSPRRCGSDGPHPQLQEWRRTVDLRGER